MSTQSNIGRDGDQEGYIVGRRKVSTVAVATAYTLGVEEIVGGIIVQDPSGGAVTTTTPTAATMYAALQTGDTDGDFKPSFRFSIINSADAAEVITVAGGTGVTFVGNDLTIAQNQAMIATWVQSSATAAVIYLESVGAVSA